MGAACELSDGRAELRRNPLFAGEEDGTRPQPHCCRKETGAESRRRQAWQSRLSYQAMLCRWAVGHQAPPPNGQQPDIRLIVLTVCSPNLRVLKTSRAISKLIEF